MGAATVGRIGYESRLDYTAIGAVVNLAARLCASAADREILMDATVADAVRGKHPSARSARCPSRATTRRSRCSGSPSASPSSADPVRAGACLVRLSKSRRFGYRAAASSRSTRLEDMTVMTADARADARIASDPCAGAESP